MLILFRKTLQVVSAVGTELGGVTMTEGAATNAKRSVATETEYYASQHKHGRNGMGRYNNTSVAPEVTVTSTGTNKHVVTTFDTHQ